MTDDDELTVDRVLQLVALWKSRKSNVPSGLGRQRFLLMQQFWKSVMTKLLPDYPELIKAIQFLNTIEETELIEGSALAAFQQIDRFSQMGVTNMNHFQNAVQKLSECPNQEDGFISFQNLNLEQEECEYYYTLYDIILQVDMPKSEEDKNTLMSDVKDYLESIKTNTNLQNYALAKFNVTSKDGSNWMNKFDWNDLQIQVINIFF